MTHSPLHGVRIAVTRPEEGADELSETLSTVGAVVVKLPLVRITGAHDPAPLERAVASLHTYDWLVFTSANAARFVARAAQLVSLPLPQPRARIVAVGAATRAAVMNELGWRVDIVPERQQGDAVVQAMNSVAPVRGLRVLWPRARGAGDAVRHELAAAGATLDDPEAYGADAIPEAAVELAHMLAQRQLDALTLTSPSAVSALAAAQPRLGSCVVAVIGTTTGAAARQAGLPVHVEPEQHSIPALVDELTKFFARSRGLQKQE